jgi:hypothetical protein
MDFGSAGKDKFETTIDVRRNPVRNVAQLRVAVLVQDSAMGWILGVGEIGHPILDKGVEKTTAAASPPAVTSSAAAILILGGNQRPPS